MVESQLLINNYMQTAPSPPTSCLCFGILYRALSISPQIVKIALESLLICGVQHKIDIVEGTLLRNPPGSLGKPYSPTFIIAALNFI